MKKKLSREQALKETIELWTILADRASEEQMCYKKEIPGPWHDYQSRCPLCQYVYGILESNIEMGDGCFLCPMYKQWNYYYTEEDLSKENVPCLNRLSPYSKWAICGDKEEEYTLLWYDLEFFCRLIAELAKEALSERGIEWRIK